MNFDSIRLGLIVALSLWLATVLQAGASNYLAVFGARPDFLLLLGLLWPLVLPPSAGAVVGLFSGALYGWMTGVSLTINAVLRSVFGYASGMAQRTGFDIDVRSAVCVASVGTVVLQCVTFFAAPPSDRGGFVRATIGTAFYNGVLAIPVFWAIRRLSGPRDDFNL